MIPWLLASAVLTARHADGADSRRQPGELKHGLGVMFGSRKRSNLTDVNSTPQLPAPPWCFMPNPGAATTATLRCPAQPVPFMSQNCGLAVELVPGELAFP